MELEKAKKIISIFTEKGLDGGIYDAIKIFVTKEAVEILDTNIAFLNRNKNITLDNMITFIIKRLLFCKSIAFEGDRWEDAYLKIYC